MKPAIWIAIIASTLLFSACDSRQISNSDRLPFSVGGVQLGAPKDSLKSPIELIGCAPETSEKAKCYVKDNDVKFDLFGAEAPFIAVKLYAPFTNIDEISAAIKGKSITRREIEEKWNLPGKCLDASEIEKIQKFDNETTGYFIKSLDEFKLIPWGIGSFICLTDSNEFVKYTKYTGRPEGSLDIYYLKDVFATNYRYLFNARAALAKSTTDVEKAFSNIRQP